MIQTSHDTPPDPARPRYTADEIARMREETQALLTAGMKAAAARVVETLQPSAPDERDVLLDRIKQDLADAKIAFAARGPADTRADARFACDALRLHRVCRRERCRKAQACRGNPPACYARAAVPEPVREWVARLLLAEGMPWLPLIVDHAANRVAYECWVAGLETGRSHRRASPVP